MDCRDDRRPRSRRHSRPVERGHQPACRGVHVRGDSDSGVLVWHRSGSSRSRNQSGGRVGRCRTEYGRAEVAPGTIVTTDSSDRARGRASSRGGPRRAELHQAARSEPGLRSRGRSCDERLPARRHSLRQRVVRQSHSRGRDPAGSPGGWSDLSAPACARGNRRGDVSSSRRAARLYRGETRESSAELPDRDTGILRSDARFAEAGPVVRRARRPPRSACRHRRRKHRGAALARTRSDRQASWHVGVHARRFVHGLAHCRRRRL